MQGYKPIIVLLEHRLEYQSIYGMNLTLYLGAEVKVATTIKAAIDIIMESNPVLIFLNNDAYSQDIGAELWQIFDNKRINTPLFILGRAKVPQEIVTVFDSKVQLRDVLRSMARSMNVTAKIMAEQDLPEYFPLPTEFLIPGWQTSIEIFIKKGESYETYFDPEDIITGDELVKLEQQNNLQLYVRKEERLKFVNSFFGQISAKLNDPNLSQEVRFEVTATGYQMVMEQSRKIGLSQGTMELANTCIESMTTIVQNIPNLNDLLNTLLAEKSSLRYKHSLLINYIGSHIIKKIPWGNRQQQDIFAFVCFFQNIALTKDAHVLIRCDKELEKSSLSDKEKTLVKNHAVIAAKLVSSAEKVPFGVSTIIKQHHGSNKGIGLSSLSLNISPLAVVFVLAQEWADLVFKFESESNRPSKKEVIKVLHHKYNKPKFNQILPILHNLEF